MSYRHSSYRKMRRAKAKRVETETGHVSTMQRHDTERLRLFYGLRPASKPPGWGVPRRKRAAQEL